MRRMDRQINNVEEMNKIVYACNHCWVAMARDNSPYLIPMNFGFQDQCLYLHSARKGLKIDILKDNPRVCIAFGQSLALKTSEIACKTDVKYHSVIVSGNAEFLTEIEEMKKALDIIVRHYYRNRTKDDLKYEHKSMEKVLIIKIQIEKMTGKKSL